MVGKLTDGPAPEVQARSAQAGAGQAALKASGVFWFLVAAAGQWLFVYYISMTHGLMTVRGEYERWNETGLIMGHAAGDGFGNAMFAAHVILAAVITFGGTLQLVPALRNRFRAFHRWNGKLFVVTALILAAGGLWMVWVRGARLSDIGSIGISLNGILILAIAPLTAWLAMKRRFDAHRRWAMRLFILVNGVWFFRIMLMGWILVHQRPLWMNNTIDGPFNLFASFACYLLPLAVLELYFRASDGRNAGAKWGVAALVSVGALATGAGIFAAWMMMWSPHL